MKILFIVSYTPSQIRTRPHNFVKSLSKLGNSITLATLWENEEEKRFLEEFSALENVRVLAYPLHRSRIVLNMLHAFINGQPLQVWYSWTPTMIEALKEEMKQGNYDVVHCEHLRGSLYGLAIQEEIKQKNLGIPVIYDSVDSISLLYERAHESTLSTKWRWITRFELPRTQKYEGYLVNHFDHTLVTTAIDKQSLMELAAKHKDYGQSPTISVVTNGVDLDYFSPNALERQPGSIIFSGKMSYHANYSMASYIINEVMPLIWTRKPDVKLFIVGKSPSEELINIAQNNPQIIVTGTVPDIRSYLQSAWVAVAPVLYGAGIQNKILEAMACSTPVVANSLASQPLQAIPNSDIIIADGPQETAGALLRVLSDKNTQTLIGQGGRKYVQNNHNWETIAKQLQNIYQKSISMVSKGQG